MKYEMDLKDRTKKFSLNIVKYVQSLPNISEIQILAHQLIRCDTSVGANTRAAFRARSDKEFKSKIDTVIEEADESSFWLELLIELREKDKNAYELQKEADELTRIFVSIRSKS